MAKGSILGKQYGDELKPVVLYSNTSGTAGAITLSQNVKNFTCIEIYYFGNWNNIGSSKISVLPSSNLETTDLAQLVIGTPNNSNTLFIYGKEIHFNGTSLTVEANSTGSWMSWNNSISATDVFKIYKVLGYKY